MATEGDRNQQHGTGSPKQNWRSRIDPRHSQNNVPVLFRLKNLQRVAADAPAEPNSPIMTGDPSGQMSPRETDRSRPIGTTASTKSHGPSPIPINHSPPSAKPDPVTTPGKHGVSNGFILLIAVVAVVFSIGRSFTKSPQVVQTAASDASTPSVAVAVPPAAVPTTDPATTAPSPTPTPTKPDEPLVIPELPKLANEESANSVTSESNNEAKRDDSGLVMLDLNADTKTEPVTEQADKLPLPSTLTTIENPNVPKSSDDATTGSDGKPATTTTAKPTGPSMASTDTPDRDIEAMMRARSTFLAQNPSNVQSQFDALARAKSTISTTSTPNFSAPQMNVAMQPSYAAQPQQNFTAAPQPNYAAAPTNTNISAQPVGYGQNTSLNAQYGSSMPNAAMPNTALPSGLTTPPTSYPLPNSPPSPQPYPQNPAPTSSTPSYTQPANQPYRPVFSDPMSMPMPNSGSTSTTNNFAVPPAPTAPVPYVPIGNTFNPSGY